MSLRVGQGRQEEGGSGGCHRKKKQSEQQEEGVPLLTLTLTHALHVFGFSFDSFVIFQPLQAEDMPPPSTTPSKRAKKKPAGQASEPTDIQ